MRRSAVSIVLALGISVATVCIHPAGDERAPYAGRGPDGRVWMPREVAGWPAPYMADDPDVSVLHEIGPEDAFRLGPFVATFSLWLVVTTAVSFVTRPAVPRRRRN